MFASLAGVVQLLAVPQKKDRATKLLKFLAEVTVNGYPGVVRPVRSSALRPAR